jgi:hypothetical protein
MRRRGRGGWGPLLIAFLSGLILAFFSPTAAAILLVMALVTALAQLFVCTALRR